MKTRQTDIGCVPRLGIAALALCMVLVTGCSLFAPPKPQINFYNIRTVTENSYGLNEQGEQYVKRERVREGDKVVFETQWPTDFTLALNSTEDYRPDIDEAEMLLRRLWQIEASGGSGEALLYGINQSDRAGEVAIGYANAAAAAATAGQTEVARTFAQAALALSEAIGKKDTADKIAAILEGAGLGTQTPETPEAE